MQHAMRTECRDRPFVCIYGTVVDQSKEFVTSCDVLTVYSNEARTPLVLPVLTLQDQRT